jgi:hypothetical protein
MITAPLGSVTVPWNVAAAVAAGVAAAPALRPLFVVDCAAVARGSRRRLSRIEQVLRTRVLVWKLLLDIRTRHAKGSCHLVNVSGHLQDAGAAEVHGCGLAMDAVAKSISADREQRRNQVTYRANLAASHPHGRQRSPEWSAVPSLVSIQALFPQHRRQRYRRAPMPRPPLRCPRPDFEAVPAVGPSVSSRSNSPIRRRDRLHSQWGDRCKHWRSAAKLRQVNYLRPWIRTMDHHSRRKVTLAL